MSPDSPLTFQRHMPAEDADIKDPMSEQTDELHKEYIV